MSNKEENTVKVKVLSDDPKKEEDKEPKLPEKALKDENVGQVEEVCIVAL